MGKKKEKKIEYTLNRNIIENVEEESKIPIYIM